MGLIPAIYGQMYKLLPDSSYYYYYGVSDGTSSWQYPDSWYYYYYKVNTEKDSVINNKTYINVGRYGITHNTSIDQLYGLAQQGNQLFLYDYYNEIEGLAMDFNLMVGDTVFNAVTGLLGQGVSGGGSIAYYHAVVVEKDSVLLSNGSYLHNLNLIGYEFDGYAYQWDITWTEQTIPLNGTNPFNSYPDNYTISGGMFDETLCTPDSLFDNLYSTYYHAGMLTCSDGDLGYTSSVDVQDLVDISIFPNPVTDCLIISTGNYSEEIMAKLYTIDGRLVKSTVLNKDSRTQIDFNNLESGFFLIELSINGNILETRRVVKS